MRKRCNSASRNDADCAEGAAVSKSTASAAANAAAKEIAADWPCASAADWAGRRPAFINQQPNDVAINANQHACETAAGKTAAGGENGNGLPHKTQHAFC